MILRMEDLLLSPETWGALLLQQLVQFGDNPLVAMWWLFLHGGWAVLIWALLWGGRAVWLDTRQSKYIAKRKFVLLAIDVPKNTEQTVKAVENMFAHLAGSHSDPSFLEKWIEGKMQDSISCEIVSIEGHIQYLIHTTRKLRDLVEASVYAQYPEAEITEVEDYTHHAPHHFPDGIHDCFAFEFTNARSDVYPIKTYVDFEHQLTGEFKDPLAVFLEMMGRLGPGEQLWYQIIITAIDQKEYVPKALSEIKKITGQEEKVHKSFVDKALDAPLNAMNAAADAVMGGGHAEEHKKNENALNSRMWNLTPGERKLVEGMERKMSKIIFRTKIRCVYIAKKEVFSKPRVAYSIVGAIKQFNTNDGGAIKPESKHVGVSSTIVLFAEARNNVRKNHLVHAYARRSNWAGLHNFYLSSEELASLWHLPVSLFVKAPQVKKTESKKTEPPINLPMG
ncbi:MAG: hypothetical protein RL141_110 [Candidatus Parcubacteria bacterium]|jgi:hypothetical protein